MFSVENIKTKEIYTVYGTVAKDGKPWFLIYKNGGWLWVDAVIHRPV
jgi:hypothetical protein